MSLIKASTFTLAGLFEPDAELGGPVPGVGGNGVHRTRDADEDDGAEQHDDDPGAVGAEDQVKVGVQLALDGVVEKEEVDDHDGHQHLEALEPDVQ